MRTTAAAVTITTLLAVAILCAPAKATSSARYPNCKTLNARYHHGVGKFGAHDHTTSGKPVTNFYRNNRVYLANRGLDRDRDGVACEKR
jgi:hypothetical protein